MTPRAARTTPIRPAGLLTAWQAELARTSEPSFVHDQWCRGHGWLLADGLADLLAPLAHDDGFGDPSFHHYTGLGPDVAARLLDVLDEDYLRTERQNFGPTIGSVLRAVVAHPDRVRAFGYLVGPGRCDERITVEGVLFRGDREYRLCPSSGPPFPPRCECDELYGSLREQLGVDDAEGPPDELERWHGPGPDTVGTGPGGPWYRAWWD